ncbi:MAG: cold-shock protein [Rhodospirillaceae bacterium]|nr:cold-shock protein [Rhodospirillaceae bacterium]
MVTATVKWFNPTKGFGFVTLSDGTPDAFLHISTIEPLGFRNLQQGAVVVCEIGDGPRGLQVKTVVEVKNTEADVSGSEADGTVKFFNVSKGFGFVVPDSGGPDVFVHARTLQQHGVDELQQGQRVRLVMAQGPKGLQAVDVVPL